MAEHAAPLRALYLEQIAALQKTVIELAGASSVADLSGLRDPITFPPFKPFAWRVRENVWDPGDPSLTIKADSEASKRWRELASKWAIDPTAKGIV